MNKNMLILFISIVLAVLGYGMAFTVLPFFIEELGGSGTQFGILLFLFGFMQLVFAPVWGKVSDKYGRKPVLILGMVGLGSSMLFFGLASAIWMLYLAQVASGILSSAMPPVAMAYISDSSSEETRSKAMGRIGAAGGLGIIVGPGFAGMLAGISLTLPFFVAAGMCLLTCLTILACLPESLPPRERITVVEKINLMEIRGMWQALSTPVALALVVAFAINFGKSNFTGAYALFAAGKFGFGAEEVGAVLMVTGLVYVLAQGLLVGPLTKKLSEGGVIQISLIGSALGFLLMLLAFDYITMLLTVGLFNLFNAVLKPATMGLISKKTASGQGAVMGIAESYMGLGRALGPLLAGTMVDININLPYLGGALFFVIMFVISLKQKNQLAAAPISYQSVEQQSRRAGANI